MSFFEFAPATANDNNGQQRPNITGRHSDPSFAAPGSTSPACITVDTDSLSGSWASRSVVSSLTSSSITLNSDKETFLRNALSRAKLLQQQEELASSLSLPPQNWESQCDDKCSIAGYEYERGIIQIENARTNARDAPRKLKAQFRHVTSDDIVNSILRKRPSLQHRTSINATLKRISQEQDRCQERIRLLKGVSHRYFDSTQIESLSDCFIDYENDDDDSSGYLSSCSASLSTVATSVASSSENTHDNHALVSTADKTTSNDNLLESQATTSTKEISPQTSFDANGPDLSSLFENDKMSFTTGKNDNHPSCAMLSTELQDVWAWLGDDNNSQLVENKRKAKKAIGKKKNSKILCFRKNKSHRCAAMGDQMSLLFDV